MATRAKEISVLGWGDKSKFIVIPALAQRVGQAQVIWAGQRDRMHSFVKLMYKTLKKHSAMMDG